MDEELEKIRLKLKALGFSRQQVEVQVGESLSGRHWQELSSQEKKEVLQSLEQRISFARRFLKFLNCNTCWK